MCNGRIPLSSSSCCGLSAVEDFFHEVVADVLGVCGWDGFAESVTGHPVDAHCFFGFFDA